MAIDLDAIIDRVVGAQPQGVIATTVQQQPSGGFLDVHEFATYAGFHHSMQGLGWVMISSSGRPGAPDQQRYFNKLIGGEGRLLRGSDGTYSFFAKQNWLGRVLAKLEKQGKLGSRAFDLDAAIDRATEKPSAGVDLDALIDQAKGVDLDAILVKMTVQAPRQRTRRDAGDRVRLQNTQGAHSKFWEGWTVPVEDGVMFHARWGRIGTDGQDGKWFFDDQAAASKKLVKKVREKRTKGYRQVGVSGAVAIQAEVQVAGQPISVMLAKTWDWKTGIDPTGWHMSEKLDGMRAYWTGQKMLTRNGNVIHIPDWLRAVLPATALDGELWLGPGMLREVVSIARKSSARDPRWLKLKYMVFDAPEAPGGCEQRFAALRKVVKTACVKWKRQGACPVVFVEQTTCRSRAQLQRFHKQITTRGGEGAMLRRARSAYVRSRTADLLKVIERVRVEARVVGYNGGTGANRGLLGSYQAELLDSRVRFNVGSGLKKVDRRNPLSIGTIITVEYKGLNPSGKPREPSYIGPRDYE